MHKYFLNVFYNKTIRKKYKLQVWHYKAYNTDIRAIKYVIVSEKVWKKEILSKDITNTTALAKKT